MLINSFFILTMPALHMRLQTEVAAKVQEPGLNDGNPLMRDDPLPFLLLS
jgi:hypothetical protein